jgi:hypothetical protein
LIVPVYFYFEGLLGNIGKYNFDLIDVVVREL